MKRKADSDAFEASDKRQKVRRSLYSKSQYFQDLSHGAKCKLLVDQKAMARATKERRKSE